MTRGLPHASSGRPPPGAQSWGAGFGRHPFSKQSWTCLHRGPEEQARKELSFTCTFVFSICGPRGLRTGVHDAAASTRPGHTHGGHGASRASVSIWCQSRAQRVLEKMPPQAGFALGAPGISAPGPRTPRSSGKRRTCALPQRGFRPFITFRKGSKTALPGPLPS